MKTFRLHVPTPIKGTGVHVCLANRIASTGRKLADPGAFAVDETYILPWDWDNLRCDVDIDQAECIAACMDRGQSPRIVTIAVDLIEFVDMESGHRGALVGQLRADWSTLLRLLRILTKDQAQEFTEDAGRRHRLGPIDIDWCEPIVREVEEPA